MAIKTLCEAGLKLCALNAGRRLDPQKDFRNHRMPWEMKFRGFGNPDKRSDNPGFVDTEWGPNIWENEITFTTAPGTVWMWPRCFTVGGKTNFWGRSSARFGDIDFRAASLDGYDVDWSITYEEVAPYYSRVERMIGVSSSVQNRPSNPDGEYLPPFNFRCLDHILQKARKRSECHTCTTASRSSRKIMTDARSATSAERVPLDATPARSSPRPGAFCRRLRQRRIWSCGRTRWQKTFSWMKTESLKAWRTLTAKRSRKLKSSVEQSWWPRPALNPRASC